MGLLPNGRSEALPEYGCHKAPYDGGRPTKAGERKYVIPAQGDERLVQVADQKEDAVGHVAPDPPVNQQCCDLSLREAQLSGHGLADFNFLGILAVDVLKLDGINLSRQAFEDNLSVFKGEDAGAVAPCQR